MHEKEQFPQERRATQQTPQHIKAWVRCVNRRNRKRRKALFGEFQT